VVLTTTEAEDGLTETEERLGRGVIVIPARELRRMPFSVAVTLSRVVPVVDPAVKLVTAPFEESVPSVLLITQE
jgi:hypothetical protein